ncbi:hypothetical protein Gotur_029802, partial [Gossypium turneri]
TSTVLAQAWKEDTDPGNLLASLFELFGERSHSCSSLIQFKDSFSINQTEDVSLFCNENAGLKSYPKTNSWKEGEVPSKVSHLSKLVSLDLSGWADEQVTIDKHALEGLVHNLTEVRHLFLDGINMSSVNAHVFMNLSSSLRSLSLAGCDLQGKFPKIIFDLPNLNLTHLDLSWNQLSGQIPLSILNLTQLEYLKISENSLEGSIPDEVTAFPNLIYLYLDNNLLNGTFPSWLYTAPSLKDIDLSQNQFRGHIKEFQSKSLELISLKNNNLQGPLPSLIFQLLNLTLLFLSSNNLSGVIEFSMFSNLPNLQLLDLSYNSLSLTSNTTSTVNLRSLVLSSCNLSESPQFLKGLKSLESLDLSCNNIEGKIPKWMQEVGNGFLTYLNVSHNSLTEVEHFPWNNIAVLDLSSNLIRGNLPIPALTVNVFLISNNSFNGEVSSLICNATYLEILDLSHNNLSGIIPQCFGNLSNSLQFLNLKKNKFYGTIPPTFAKGCRLTNFNLNGNLLEGPLTPSILNCNGLEVLDL